MLLHRLGDLDVHQCVVAGRKADGGLTDIWSEVRPHLDFGYVSYVPRCECGWTGPPFTYTPGGYAACEQLWRDQHLELFLRAQEPRAIESLTTWALTSRSGCRLR
ncbi:MAG: hypothetical protein ACRDRO_20195 [Pseudonocardiaceae bacterium]